MHCKFVNGDRNFEKKREILIITQLIHNSTKNLVGQTGEIVAQIDQRIKYFLRRRGIERRFHKSGLEKAMNELRLLSESQLNELGDLNSGSFED